MSYSAAAPDPDSDHEIAPIESLLPIQEGDHPEDRHGPAWTLATTLAHELTQPLTALRNYLAGLQHRLTTNPPDPLELERILELATDQIDRAGEVIWAARSFVETGNPRRGEEAFRLLREARACQPPTRKCPSGREEACGKKIEALTERQIEVLRGIAAGKPNKIIAFDLGLSTRTVETYRALLFQRLGVRTTAEAVCIAIHAGLT